MRCLGLALLVFALVLTGILGSLAVSASAAEEEKVLHIYNWSDYIAPDTIGNFEKETGIKVTYDLYDSNEVLEAKMLAGNTGYDLVAPGSDFMARQIKAGVYRKLNKDNIPNWKNISPVQLKLLDAVDPGNQYSIPYEIGTTGIGYNVDKFEALFGKGAKPDSWDYFFKPENMKKLSTCGVAVLNAPTEIIATALHYLGYSAQSENIDEYKEARKLLLTVRPYINYFHSSQFINDLANGDICMAIGWSGDILQGSERAKEANNGVHVDYIVPKEGALIFYDMMTIPADADHPENAEKFMNYLLRPEVMASISSYVHYFNAVPASKPLVDKETSENPNIFLPDELLSKMFMVKPMPPKITKEINKIWTKIKSTRTKPE